ncbi:hypothetical protein N1851_012280 [Merluccius polli]|uniref:Uncharacterized protein n=1 Tax=Merluccius polli TaxID=89951 RepID=A0AA47MWP1_MERPO|nr:hypothetical protein N1851_012280 [Merluccius polli]
MADILRRQCDYDPATGDSYDFDTTSTSTQARPTRLHPGPCCLPLPPTLRAPGGGADLKITRAATVVVGTPRAPQTRCSGAQPTSGGRQRVFVQMTRAWAQRDSVPTRQKPYLTDGDAARAGHLPLEVSTLHQVSDDERIIQFLELAGCAGAGHQCTSREEARGPAGTRLCKQLGMTFDQLGNTRSSLGEVPLHLAGGCVEETLELSTLRGDGGGHVLPDASL